MWTNLLKRHKLFYQITLHSRTSLQRKNKLSYLNYSQFKCNFSRTLFINPVCYSSSNINSDKNQQTSVPQFKVEKSTFLEKIVNKCPNGVQPYLRLIRFDKPTGKIVCFYTSLYIYKN